MITLHEHDCESLTSLGFGCLDDELESITITEELNGMFELEATYNIYAKHFNDLKSRRIIYAKPNPYDPPQPFRIYNISTPIDGTVTIQAEHKSYDTSGYPVNPFTTKTARGAIAYLKKNSVIEHNFHFSTDVPDPEDLENALELEIDTPKSTRSILGDDILPYFGGEYKFDGNNIQLLQNRGVDRGFTIEYGKNITDVNQEINCSEVYTGVYPYWKGTVSTEKEDGTIEQTEEFFTLPEKIVEVEGEFGFNKIMPYDVSSLTNVKPTEEALREFTKTYIEENHLAVPKISITASFADIYASEGYEELKVLNKVMLGDTVTIKFKDANIETTAKCIKTVYNPLIDEYESIELGDASSALDTGINNIVTGIDKEVAGIINDFDKYLQFAIDTATNLINQGLGGFVIKNRNELLICDTDNKYTATKVWRWNINGLGYSSNGYSGPYTTAITMDGKFVINEVTAQKFTAALINTGTLSSVNGKVKMNLEDERIEVSHDEFGTKTVIDAEGFYILDGNGETIASLASKKSWSELKAEKVFASNINTIYMGPSNLYVNFDATVTGDGTIDKPFGSFYELTTYLNQTKIINKDINIYVSGTNVLTEQLKLEGFSGYGLIFVYYDKQVVHRCSSTAIELYGCTNPIYINGGKSGYDSNDGAVICNTEPAVTNSSFNRVIRIRNCFNVRILSLNLEGNNYSILSVNSFTRVNNVDFCNTPNGVAGFMGAVQVEDCVGNCTKDSMASYEGCVMVFGTATGNGYYPKGSRREYSGLISYLGNCVEKPSFRYPPAIPPTNVYTGYFTNQSLGTYQYAWGNWSSGEAKQGTYGSYGNKAGHLFFAVNYLREFINGGTVLDGCSISITRANSGGNSGKTAIYINASTASSASGTPSYSHNQYLGSLAWGETGTFNLPTSIVNALNNGSANSIAFYSTSDPYAYVNITWGRIYIKVRK